MIDLIQLFERLGGSSGNSSVTIVGCFVKYLSGVLVGNVSECRSCCSSQFIIELTPHPAFLPEDIDQLGCGLVVANLGGEPGRCFTSVPLVGLEGRTLLLRDLLGEATYRREGDDLASRGLYLDMPAGGYHAFAIEDAS